MNRSTVRCFLTVLACTALKGCVAMQMYPGPTLPDDQIATIEPAIAYYWIFGDREVAAVSFDSGLIGEPLAVLEVLPGRHLVGVRYIGSAFGTPVRNDNPCYLVVDAAAGHQYKVDG